jgi:hypothetical protein
MRNLNGNFRFMSKLKEQDFCFSKEGGWIFYSTIHLSTIHLTHWYIY